MVEMLHVWVPVAVPVPPQSACHVTLTTLSDATPRSATVLDGATQAESAVGEVMSSLTGFAERRVMVSVSVARSPTALRAVTVTTVLPTGSAKLGTLHRSRPIAVPLDP